MNQTTYEQFNFNPRQNLFIFIYLTNKSSLSSTIKQVMLKHNNIFMKNVMNITLIYLYRLEILFCLFVNRSIRYHIIDNVNNLFITVKIHKFVND